MTRALSFFVLLALWSAAEAQQFRRPLPVHSVTRQFSSLWKVNRAPQPIISGTNGVPAIVRVNSHSLILFAEETKKRMLRELGSTDLWSGHITLRIMDLPAGTKTVMERQPFTDCWR